MEQQSFAVRHGQPNFPTRPIYARFTFTVEQKIKQNPLGAICFAAKCLADKEALFRYVDSLPVPEELRNEIRHILTIEYNRNGSR